MYSVLYISWVSDAKWIPERLSTKPHIPPEELLQ